MLVSWEGLSIHIMEKNKINETTNQKIPCLIDCYRGLYYLFYWGL